MEQKGTRTVCQSASLFNRTKESLSFLVTQIRFTFYLHFYMIYKVPIQADKKGRGNEDEELTQNMNNKWLVVCSKSERNVSQLE